MAILILMLALFLRLPSIFRGDFAFAYDAGRDLLAIRDLLGGNVSLIGPTTGLSGLFYGPWWYWVLTPWFVLFRGSPIALTAIIAFYGSFAAAAAYVWGKRFIGIRFGLIIGLILAASPGVIKLTNQLWNPSLVVPTAVFVIILLSNLRVLSMWKFFLLGFFLLLLVEFEIVFGILFGIGFVISCLLWFRKVFSWVTIRTIFFGALLCELPRILFEFRHGFIQTQTILAEVGSGSLVFEPKRSWLIYESISSIIPGTPLVQQIVFLGSMSLLIIFWKNINRKLQRLMLSSLTIVAVFWVVPFFYAKDFWNYYMVGLPVLYSIVLAGTWEAIPKRFKKIGYIALAIYFFFLIQPGQIISSLKNPNFVGNAAVYRNQRAVMEFISTENHESFKYIAYNPSQHDYNWQFLFWQYKKINKIPMYTNDDPQLMYVVMEPDDAYPDRLKNWLKIRERDGVVLREITFPSGLVLQVRRLRWN